MAFTLRNLCLLISIISPVFAIPTTDPTTPQIPLFHESPSTYPGSYRSPFRRLRDSLIETIWNVPKKSHTGSSAIQVGHPAPASFQTKYNKDLVLRFKITTEDEAKAFSEAAEILYLDIWDVSSHWVDVRIAKTMVPSFLNLLPPSLQMSYTRLIYDLAQTVYDTYPTSLDNHNKRKRPLATEKRPHDLFFDHYQPISVIYPWLHLLTKSYPHHAESFSLGESAEGRDIPAIRIRVPREEWETDDPDAPRETILIVGGSHAREWISVSTVAYVAFELITRYEKPNYPIITRVLRNYDIVLVPVLNPDGYEYTWSTDRLWRKSRQQTDLPFCPGIDIDHGFGFGWDGHDGVDNPCTDFFAGEHPFQSVEARLLSDWALNETKYNKVEITSFLDLHSYSQKVLYPYSYSCSDRSPHLEDLLEVAAGIAKSYRVTTGHWYGVGPACEGQYVTLKPDEAKIGITANNNGGSAIDYFHHDLNVLYSFQIKLRDRGSYGFLLPAEHIIPSGRETYEAVVGLGHWLLSNRGVESGYVDGFITDEVVPDSEEKIDEEELAEHEEHRMWSRKGLASLTELEALYPSCKDKDILPPFDTDVDDSSHLEDNEEWEIVLDEEAMALRWKRR